MDYLYSVKEVCELTGLTRKLLFDYDENNIVKASMRKNPGTNSDGYKYYDEAAVIKLQQISIFRMLGMSRAEIKKRITAKDYDSNALLDEQIKMLKDRKKEIDVKIKMAEELKVLGLNNSDYLDFFAGMGTKEYSQLSERIYESPILKNIMDNEQMNLERYNDQILEVFTEAKSIADDAINSNKANELAGKIIDLSYQIYGVLGLDIVFNYVGSKGSGGTIDKVVQSLTDENTRKLLNTIVTEYIDKQIDMFYEEAHAVTKKYRKYFGKDYKNPKIIEMTNKLFELTTKYFRISNKQELYAILMVTPINLLTEDMNNVEKYVLKVFIKNISE